MHHLVDVELIEHGIGIFGKTRSENDHFKELTDHFEELVDIRTLENIDIMTLAINLHGNNKVGVFYRLKEREIEACNVSHHEHVMRMSKADLEGAVDERLIHVENKTLAIPELSGRLAKK